MAFLAKAAGAIVGNEPIPNPLARTPHYWHDGLCSCCDNCGICCQMCCCLWCSTSNISNKLELNDPSCECGTCLTLFLLDDNNNMLFTTITAFAMRRQLIEKYNIHNESYCASCCNSICCACCSQCQLQREMCEYNDYPGGCCYEDLKPAVIGQIADAISGIAGGVATLASGEIPHMPGQWNSQVCDCTCSEFCDMCCCHCCMQAFMGHKLDMGRVPEKPANSPNDCDCPTCCAGFWTQCGMTYALRRELIEKYNIINEPFLSSLTYSTICCPFATAQQRREMGFRGDWPGGCCQSEARTPPNVLTSITGQ